MYYICINHSGGYYFFYITYTDIKYQCKNLNALWQQVTDYQELQLTRL